MNQRHANRPDIWIGLALMVASALLVVGAIVLGLSILFSFHSYVENFIP